MLRDLLLKPYYIANFLLILAYPFTRVFKMFRFDRLDNVDELGLTKENTLFYTIIAFAILKWMKRYSTTQFLGDLFFSIKVALVSGYIFVDINLALLYFSACLIIWLLFKQPEYTGQSRIKKIKTINEFEDLLDIDIKEDNDVVEEIQEKFDTKSKSKKKKQKPQSYYRELAQIVFVEFYVDWAETCNYTKEIWAEFSMKYTTKKFAFASVDLQKLPKLAELYSINTSSISRQLPTIILFENGEEIQRFPPIDKKTRRIAKVLRYDKKEIQNYFDLDRRYLNVREE